MSKQPASKDTPENIVFERWLTPTWAPPLLFAVFTIVYFAGFLFSSDVMQGLDTRMEFYLGKQPAAEKIADLAPENWDRYLGGTPVSGFRQPKYFPLYPIYVFTTYHRYLGWRYVFATLFAGYFTYLCIQGFGLRRTTSAFSGLAYASSPTLLTFIYPGQEGKMLVMGLLPLMVWALYRLMDTRKPVWVFVLAAGVAGGIYTPHLQMLYYALIGLGILFAIRLIQDYLNERDIRLATVRSALAASGIILGLAVGAVGTFPAYKYTKTESRRAGDKGQGVSIEYARSWALHPEEMASLLIPEYVHFYKPHEKENLYWGRNQLKLNAEYFGIAVFFLAVVAIARVRTDPRVLPLLALAVITAAYALGPYTPVFAFFYHFVPGMNVLRTPGMIAFLFAFPAVILAAFSLEKLLDGDDSIPEKALLYGGGGAAALFGILAISPEATLSTWTSVFWSDIPKEKLAVATANLPSLSTGAGLAFLWVALLTGLIYLRVQKRIPAQTFLLALLPILFIDTWRIDKQYLKYVDPDRFPDPNVYIPQTLNILESDTDYHRTWIPASDVQLPESIDLLTVDYHEPFILRRYDRVTDYLLRGLIDGRGEETYRLLNALNVKYVAIGAQKLRAVLPALALPGETEGSVQLRPGVEAVANERNVYTFRNGNARPFFYLVGETVTVPDEDAAMAMLTSSEFDAASQVILEAASGTTSGRPVSAKETVAVSAFDARTGVIKLQVHAAQPRTLVVCQNYHPYWSATLNGSPVSVQRANYVWQAIDIPAGKHTVTLTYHDSLAQTCRWISLLSAVSLIGGLIYFGRPAPKPALTEARNR
ncbi:MAG: hypothetical protein CME19_03730 [Gemmatimonadetes bacterium]|nr:hypothetical protein [Gemmatimonadota bacterium]|tara:strand:- start:1248 stop:3710 length:2463 start_codon:yes stop_codon:yes gene_type:complete